MENVDVHKNAQSQLIESLDLKEIKDPEKLIIKNDGILIKTEFKSNSGIILADNVKSSVDKLRVIKVGKGVNDYKVGDYILDIINPRGVTYLHKGDDRYLLTNEFNINLGTTIDNIE
jgi:co-chaperonin GroES (HSP10)